MTHELTFLYVEDDLFSRKMMTMLMTQGLGYEHFIVFENSIDFMKRLEHLPAVPDIIFLDIHVQPANGYEMLRMLRDHGSYNDITVIALTASVMNEEINKLQKAGFDGCIAKPLDSDVFAGLLDRILNGEQIWHI